jgi:hypothetical protein
MIDSELDLNDGWGCFESDDAINDFNDEWSHFIVVMSIVDIFDWFNLCSNNVIGLIWMMGICFVVMHYGTYACHYFVEYCHHQ